MIALDSKIDTERKICIECGASKSLNAYAKRSDTGRLRNICKDCRNKQSQEWVAANLTKRRSIALKWAKANYPYIRKKKAEYRARDPIAVRRWSIDNPEKMDACRRDWDRRNPHRKLQHARNRQARKRNAIPKWADQKAMDAIYRRAREFSLSTGEVFEVDHIVPLKGPTVCGLHCEQNLEVVRRNANRVKGCFRWPDMP